MKLIIEHLFANAKEFADKFSTLNHESLLGVSDGKAIGTYVEKAFKEHLKNKNYSFEKGNSASGIDLPSVNTDIKVTSLVKPQSSCPFKSARQKVYGLGYNLLVFVYNKEDQQKTKRCRLNITNVTLIEKERTGDATLTKQLIRMLENGTNKEEILSQFENVCLPGDEIVLSDLADEVLKKKPKQGFLTISNALQWRLKYKTVIELKNTEDGVSNYDRN